MTGKNDKIIYDVVLEQQKINVKTFDAVRNRAATIISFVGVILNLELVVVVQVATKNSPSPFLIFLVCSSIILFVCLFLAFLAFKGSLVAVIGANEFIDEYYKEKEEKKVIRAAYATMADNIDDNRKLSTKKNGYLNDSISLLILGLFFMLLFFITYTTSLFI